MPVLRIMATSKLTEEEIQAIEIAQIVEKGWIKSKETKTTLALLKAELMRRYNLLKETVRDDLPKKIPMKVNIKDLEDCLDRVRVSRAPQ